MNNTQNLVNNGDNAILQQKNYPLDISEYEKMCSSDGYKTCGDGIIAPKGEFVEIIGFMHFSKVFRFSG